MMSSVVAIVSAKCTICYSFYMIKFVSSGECFDIYIMQLTETLFREISGSKIHWMIFSIGITSKTYLVNTYECLHIIAMTWQADSLTNGSNSLSMLRIELRPSFSIIDEAVFSLCFAIDLIIKAAHFLKNQFCSGIEYMICGNIWILIHC